MPATSGQPDLSRPGSITLLAILNFLACAFLLIGALGLIALKTKTDAPAELVLVAAALALCSVLVLIGGIGLWNLRGYGRLLQLIFAWIGALTIVGALIAIPTLLHLYSDGVKVLFSGKKASQLSPIEIAQVERLDGSPIVIVIVAMVVLMGLSVPIAGIVSAIAIPNLLNAIQRGKQKRTMADLRALGVTVGSYVVDHGFIPQVDSSDDAARSLAPYLQPTYILALPLHDGWESPFPWSTDGDSYTITSLGKDRRPDAAPQLGATTNFNADIYFSDGGFVRWPEGIQH